MTAVNCYQKVSKSIICSLLVACFSICLLTIPSCTTTTNETAGYSEAFKPIFDHTTFLFLDNKTDEGLRYLDSALNQIKPGIDDKFRAYGFHYVYWKKARADNKKALLYADSMLQMARKSVTQQQYAANFAEANFAMGDAYFDMQQFNDAYQHYFQGYMAGKNYLNNSALSDYTYRMGMIMYKQGHYKLAANYFKESYQKTPNTTDAFADFFRRQELLDNIGLSYKHDNSPDSAILYFTKALTFIDQNIGKHKDRLNMLEMAKGVVYGNKAEVLILKHNYPEAIGLLKRSIAINLKKGNDNHDAELSEIKLAQLYYDTNEIEQLYKLLQIMRPQLDSVKNEDADADWNRLMSKYYVHKNDFKKALNYLQAYNSLKDSSIKKLNRLRESDVNQQLANYEKQYQIDDLKGHNKLQSIYLYVAIICALMALVIIFLVYRNWTRSKRDIEIVNDLNTQINQQKADLEKTLEELEDSSLEKDRILRTVAHDLRNPLGGIASLTGIMEEDEDYTSEQRELLTLIKDTSHDTILLINEILEVTQNNSTELNRQFVEINSLLNNSVELLRFKAAEKNQRIVLETLEVPVELWISREKIWRVMSNLISNAIKFSPIGATINVKVILQGNEVQISVNDYGIGIPDNIKDKVFDIFTEAKRNGTTGEKSFGLGLSICRQIIEKHHGKIWFESNIVNGTTFYVQLAKPVSPTVLT